MREIQKDKKENTFLWCIFLTAVNTSSSDRSPEQTHLRQNG